MSVISRIPEVFTSSFNQFIDYLIDSFKHPSLTNPYWTLIVISVICFLLEAFLPKKHNYPLLKRKGFKLDLVYIFFVDFVFWGLGFYAALCVVEFLFLSMLGSFGISSPVIMSISALPEFIQLAVLFVTEDFLEFSGHWMLHRFDFLWSFHKIHHAQEQLGFASTRHFHWFEYFIFKPLLYIPFSMIGFSTATFFIFQLWTGYFLTNLSHCNIKLNWGRLNNYIITPETHYWHHAQNIPARYGVNYASVLNIWDRMFGTFYLPKDKEPKLGIPDMHEVPDTFFGQMIYPFKILGKKSDQANNQTPKAPVVIQQKIKKSLRKKLNRTEVN